MFLSGVNKLLSLVRSTGSSAFLYIDTGHFIIPKLASMWDMASMCPFSVVLPRLGAGGRVEAWRWRWCAEETLHNVESHN